MRAVLTEPFAANLIASPPEVQKAFGKQLTNLLRDLRHPSLRARAGLLCEPRPSTALFATAVCLPATRRCLA